MADASQAQVVSSMVDLAVQRIESRSLEPALAFALHVGGLNSRADCDLVDAMAAADLVYADGGSVVWLARRAGGRVVERAPTTDIGWSVLHGVRERIGRRPRIALIGGPSGLAQRAGAVFSARGAAEPVIALSGFEPDWSAVLRRVRSTHPDVCLVGLGAPTEMCWCQDWREELPGSLVMTCGGWFGHVVGDEKRAPHPLRRSGLEWIARVAQQPRRLAPRYARGLVSTVRVAVEMGRYPS